MNMAGSHFAPTVGAGAEISLEGRLSLLALGQIEVDVLKAPLGVTQISMAHLEKRATLRKIGELQVDSFAATFLWRATFQVLKRPSRERFLTRLTESFRQANNFIESRVTPRLDGSITVHINEVGRFPEVFEGILHATFAAAGHQARVTEGPHEGVGCEYEIRFFRRHPRGAPRLTSHSRVGERTLCLTFVNGELCGGSKAVWQSLDVPFVQLECMATDDHFIPFMRLGHCVFVSVPAELTDSHARFLQETVSQRLSVADGVRGLVLDVSALSLIDSFAAKILGETASIAQQFGVKGVLVGVRPSVAVTLVELGIDLRHVETALTLELALKKLRLRIVSIDE